MFNGKHINNPDLVSQNELENYVDIFETLRHYCMSRMVRDRHIKLGNQFVVDRYQKEMDRLYNSLPAWVQWNKENVS